MYNLYKINIVPRCTNSPLKVFERISVAANLLYYVLSLLEAISTCFLGLSLAYPFCFFLLFTYETDEVINDLPIAGSLDYLAL